MKLQASLLAVALSAAAVHCWANDVPLTDEEVNATIVGKNILWKLDDGKTYQLELAEGGKATVSGPYNDVGKWRMNSPGGYCTTWNKQAMTEACVKLVKRDGVVTSLRPDGSFRGTVVGAK